jgi:hypothetical protein
MKEVMMVFPDTSSMSDFIVNECVSNAEVNSFEQTLVAPISERQIVKAETVYGAILKTVLNTSFYQFSFPVVFYLLSIQSVHQRTNLFLRFLHNDLHVSLVQLSSWL